MSSSNHFDLKIGKPTQFLNTFERAISERSASPIMAPKIVHKTNMFNTLMQTKVLNQTTATKTKSVAKSVQKISPVREVE